jgi:chemotaxis protein MotB
VANILVSSRENCRDTFPEMARRQKRAEHENLDRWLVSYADFITLLFAFFVVMYAISSVNEGKYKIFSASLISVFGNKGVKPEATASSGEQEMLLKSLVERRNARLAERQRIQQERLQAIAHNLNQVLDPLLKSGQVSITQTERGLVLEINASVLFDSGEAVLQGGVVKTLTHVAQVLQQGDNAIEVEGHTDDVAISTVRFPSNWELSSARASSVVRMFIEHGVAAVRLTAVGSADNHPVAPNATPEGRARNRRVTVTIMAPAAEKRD